MDSTITPTAFSDQISSIRVTGLQPHIITGVLLQVLREHFREDTRLDNEYLSKFVWVPKDTDKIVCDPVRTSIIIDPIYRWDRVTTQARPGIIIKRNAIKPEKIGFSHNTYIGLGSDSLPEAGTKHTMMFRGSHTIFCIATDGGAVEVLSTEVATHLAQFAPVLQSEFGFNHFYLSQIGEVTVLEEEKENYVVPVAFEYAYQNNWVLAKQEPRLKTVSLKVD